MYIFLVKNSNPCLLTTMHRGALEHSDRPTRTLAIGVVIFLSMKFVGGKWLF